MPEKQTIRLSLSLRENLNRFWTNFRYLLLGKLFSIFRSEPLDCEFDCLDTFCCFVGHGRSGSTLVGALLNAHPNVVLSNEVNALRLLKNGLTATQTYRLIRLVSQRQARRGSPGGGGYTYAVDGQWQGRHEHLRVIGDRKAGATAYEISRDDNILDMLDNKIKLKLRFIHVVRNPFDVIATTYSKTAPDRGHDGDQHLMREINNYFLRCASVQRIESRFGKECLHFMFHEKLLTDPAFELRRICDFLEIEPYSGYVDACSAIVKDSPNRTRQSLAWSKEVIEIIEFKLSKFSWLKDYKFNS